MRIKDIIIISSFAVSAMFSCTGKSDSKDTEVTDMTECAEDIHTVFSDDSLIVAYWWDTGDGGTAPDIEALCRYRTESGKMKEERHPLLGMVCPDEDCVHHEIEKIVSLDTEYDRRFYLFFLRAKTGSNEYAHDIVALSIEGDSLSPVRVFCVGDEYVPHISLRDL